MGKALLVGNGFSARLIESYNNNNMMRCLWEQCGAICRKVDNSFERFRNSSGNREEKKRQALDVLCQLNKSVRVKKEMIELAHIYKLYFEDYNLIAEVGNKNLSSVENYLKVIDLLKGLDDLADCDEKAIKAAANRVYYNGGKNGANEIGKQKKEIYSAG